MEEYDVRYMYMKKEKFRWKRYRNICEDVESPPPQ
jgi:hypothetical protein